MEFITNNKGGSKLCFEGFMYTQKTTTGRQIQWQCSNRRAYNCKACLYTSLEKENPHVTKPHSHDPDFKAIEVAKSKAEMKAKAKTSREKPAQILSGQLAEMSEDIRGAVGNLDSLKRNIRNVQRGARPKEPKTLSELTIEDEWAQTATGQQFLIHDSGPGSNQRVIVFASSEGIRHLATKGDWFMDGTFDTAPKLFTQLYIIRAKLGESAVSCAYALLTGKSQGLYEEMLRAICDKAEELGFTLDPEIVHMDFERSVINAVAHTFGPHVTTKGCFYHLTQSSWRKVQELGLSSAYKEDPNIKHFCGMIDGLSFLPEDDVHAGMMYLKDHVPTDLEPLLDYFDATYVSGTYRPIRRPGENGEACTVRFRKIPPVFSPGLWNVHEATLAGGDRTNNHCESWNNSFKQLVGHSHPSVWRLITHLKEDESLMRTLIIQENRGQPPTKRVRKTTKDLQRRLLYLCEARKSGT